MPQMGVVFDDNDPSPRLMSQANYRMHFDISPTDRDQETELVRCWPVGARRAERR